MAVRDLAEDDKEGAPSAALPRRGERASALPAFIARVASDRSLSVRGRSYSNLVDEPQASPAAAAAATFALLEPHERERLSKAASKIAAVWRTYLACRRMQLSLIQSFQPDAFRLKSGEPAEYGQVAFEAHGAREPARYIRLSDESDVDRVVGLVRTVWDVRDAQVVISLTGGALDLKLKPHVHDVFNRGLVRAAQQTNAWIVTGGTDTGVMKLVGEAVRDYQADVPCIGVATWGAVHGREILAANHGRDEFFIKTKANDTSGAALEPNHTHFLLVDTGKEGGKAWGGARVTRRARPRDIARRARPPTCTRAPAPANRRVARRAGEIDFRTRFEQTYCRRSKVPMVLVVVGGSGGTLQTIERAAENKARARTRARRGAARTRRLSAYPRSLARRCPLCSSPTRAARPR